MVQTAPAASCVSHVLDSWNCALNEMEIEVRGKPPALVMVTDSTEESWPSGVDGKVSDMGLRMSVGGDSPVPLSSTVCVPAPSVKVSKPEAGPACAGANSTANWQSVFGARLVVPQELPLGAMLNGAVIETLLIGTAEALLLAAVTCSGVDVTPTST